VVGSVFTIAPEIIRFLINQVFDVLHGYLDKNKKRLFKGKKLYLELAIKVRDALKARILGPQRK
jgi:hypothetical protein